MRRRISLVALALAVAAGCTDAGVAPDSEYGHCYAAPEGCIDPTGRHHTYVVSEVRLPTSAIEARELGLDINGDPQGRPDNGLAAILSTLFHAAEVDAEAYVNERLASGAQIYLVDFQATDMHTAADAGGRVYLARSASPAPCGDPADLATCGRHLGGTGEFEIDGDVPMSMVMVGALAGGEFVGGPNQATFELELPDLAIEPMVLRTIGTRAVVTVHGDDRIEGVVAGAVDAAAFKADLFRMLVAMAARDCAGTAPGCCVPDSEGAKLIEALDADGDCALTVTELEANRDLATVMDPDVDMLDEHGVFNPRRDGVMESVSLGFGFVAVAADFDVP